MGWCHWRCRYHSAFLSRWGLMTSKWDTNFLNQHYTWCIWYLYMCKCVIRIEDVFTCYRCNYLASGEELHWLSLQDRYMKWDYYLSKTLSSIIPYQTFFHQNPHSQYFSQFLHVLKLWMFKLVAVSVLGLYLDIYITIWRCRGIFFLGVEGSNLRFWELLLFWIQNVPACYGCKTFWKIKDIFYE